MHYHLAQVSAVNVGADRAPGFVWRLHRASSVGADGDPLRLFDLSVWETVDDLKRNAAGAGHLAMWWIPAGHIPSVEEAVERLDYRRTHGDTEAAFSFSHPHPPPDAPAIEPVELPIDLDGRVFATASNTPNGDAGGGTRFEYRQRGGRVWAIYRGGRVRFGSLVAAGDPLGRLDMRYQHVGADGAIRTGVCLSVPELLPDGRVRLVEEWQWTNGDRSRGRSVVEEVARG